MSNVLKVTLLKNSGKKSKAPEKKGLEMPKGIRDKGLIGVNYIGGGGHQLEDPNFQALLGNVFPGYEK